MPECELNQTPKASTFSPKARQAMQEVLDVLRKHDLAGYIVLCDKGHAEVRTRFPTWSVVHIQSEGGKTGIRIKAKSGREGDDLASTINMLSAFFDQPARMALDMDDILKMLRKHVEFETKTEEGPAAPPWDFK